MLRVAIILLSGVTEGETFSTIEECYEYLLKKEYKKYMIMDTKTKVIIERGGC